MQKNPQIADLMLPHLKTKAWTEADKCRERVEKYCTGFTLDIGAGQGKITEDAYGLDVGYGEGVDLIQDATELRAVKNNSVDTIYSGHLLEEVPVPIEFMLRKWQAKLVVGGHLILYLPNQRDYVKYCREHNEKPNPEHCHDWEMEDVVKTIESLGCFDIISANYYEDEYSFEIVAQKNDKPVITPIERIEIKRIFVNCMFSGLGDMWYTLPFLQKLRDQFPDSEILIATTPMGGSILKCSKPIGNVIQRPYSVRDDIVIHLQEEEDFDLAINFHFDMASHREILASNAKLNVGVSLLYESGYFLPDNVYDFTTNIDLNLDGVEKEFYPLFEYLGIDYMNMKAEISYNKDECLADVSNIVNNAQSSPYIVIHPGATGYQGRAWGKFNELVSDERLKDFKKVIIGKIPTDSDEKFKWEKERYKVFKKIRKDDVINLVDKVSLEDIIHLCTRATAYVGNDTGTTHVASGIGTPTVNLMGSGNPHRWLPKGNSITIRKTLWCNAPNGCRYSGRLDRKCDDMCMKSIPVDDVVLAIQEVSIRNSNKPLLWSV